MYNQISRKTQTGNYFSLFINFFFTVNCHIDIHVLLELFSLDHLSFVIIIYLCIYLFIHSYIKKQFPRSRQCIHSLKTPDKSCINGQISPLASDHHGLLIIPYTDWLHHPVSSSVSWCVVGVLAQYGCRHIIQVDATHWWWLRRPPTHTHLLW